MSLNFIQNAYKNFQKDPLYKQAGKFWNLTELISSLACHLLYSDKKDEDEDYMSLRKFSAKYTFVTYKGLGCQIREKRGIFKFSKMECGRWFVKEKECLDYLVKLPIYRNRIKRGLNYDPGRKV